MTLSNQTVPAAADTPSFTPASTPHDDARAQQLVEAARRLGPLIREHAEETERNRRLAGPVLEALRAAGLMRMFTPRSLGGLEVDPVTCARVAEEVASFDSAAAWALQAGTTGAWWCARLPEAGAAEVFVDGPDVIMAGSFQAPQQAVPVPGGYRFTGRGPLASTIHDASWLMIMALVMEGGRPRLLEGGVPEVIAVVLPTRDVQVIDTWRSLGMRGTDSNDAAAADLFVPASRAFSMAPRAEHGPHFRGPLYDIPAIASVLTIVPPVALAIARAAVAELRELAQRKTPATSMKTLREKAAVQAAVAEAEGLLRSARLLFYDAMATTWRLTSSGAGTTLEQKADLLLASAHAMKSAVRAVELMHRAAGTSGVYETSPLERHFRDIQTIRHHAFASESRLETVGQVYLGVPPEFGLVAY
jgi:indole-3-acetate monooxygenase